MLFVVSTIFIWVIFIFVFRRFNRKAFGLPNVILPLLIFSVMITFDLGLNYVASAVPSLNDGIRLHGVWSSLIFGDERWEVARFYTYYSKWVYISLGLLFVYMMTMIIRRDKS